MAVILWSVVALGLAFVAVLLAAYYSRSIAPPLVLPAGESLPPTPLQRAVRWSLALSLPILVAIVALVAWFGPVAYFDNDPVRLAVTALLIAGMLVLVAPIMLVGTWARQRDNRLDERDRTILGRAPAGQAAAMLIVLAVWTIALQESYRGQPGIPHTYLYLIFWSCLLVSLLASNLGILIGYRRT
jgi:hypothetical protein